MNLPHNPSQIPQRDVDVLRGLAERQAQIADLPCQREKADLWRRLNQLEPTRPLIWINEIPWHEMNVNDELTLRCTDPWARTIETELRRLIYQWEHLPGDMVVGSSIPCPLIVRSGGFGITEDVDIAVTDKTSDIVSRHFNIQIREPEDIKKIRFPHVTHDVQNTELAYQTMSRIFKGILPVEKMGFKGTWFAPWDELIRWWGVTEAMLDLVLRPQMVYDFVAHLVDAYLHELDQWEALNLLSRNDNNTRIGSGGYGYTDELPTQDYDPGHLRTQDLWGSATAQIFSGVSPDMHWEFALKHELRWLERWGLTYYGCCEPLDGKIDLLKRIPNLRKISMSPWVDVRRAAERIGTDYVFSLKPSPAGLAEDTWRPEHARHLLSDALNQARGCRIEVIMKDVSTVRYEPQRLWEWEQIAMETVQDFRP